jgi:hypothetical protein
LPYDLAAVGDPVGVGLAGAGNRDRGEAAAGVEETTLKGLHALPWYCPTIWPLSLIPRAWVKLPEGGDIDGGEAATCIHEAMCPHMIEEISQDLAAVVDRLGQRG